MLNIDNNKSNNEGIGTDGKISLNEKYEIWRWDIDQVTNNRDSYKIQKGNHDVKVAIIDSGIDIYHPDLKNNIIFSKSFVPGDNSLDDIVGHGTMVAGEIAANGMVKGVAPNIGIASYKVFDGYKCMSEWVVNAIIQAAKDNMDVINISLGTYKSLLDKEQLSIINAYIKSIEYARSRNCVIVVAGENIKKGKQPQLGDTREMIYLPGGLNNVITVSATNRDGNIADYAKFNEDINILAPAGEFESRWCKKKTLDLEYTVLVTYPTNLKQSIVSSSVGLKKGYEFIEGGTSLAAPKVSAAAALLIAEYQEKKGEKPLVSQVEKWLYEGATPYSNKCNLVYNKKGILNVKNSLNLIKMDLDKNI